jgi:hypothetical protein
MSVLFASGLALGCVSELERNGLSSSPRCKTCDSTAEEPSSESEPEPEPDAASPLSVSTLDAAADAMSSESDGGPNVATSDASASASDMPLDASYTSGGTSYTSGDASDTSGDAGASPATTCGAGTYVANSKAGAAECSKWRTCVSGEFVAEAGDAAHDRSCEPCPKGESSEGNNAASCSLPGECAVGSQHNEDGACEACPAGSYCAGGEALAEECAAATWDDDGDAATACAMMRDCLAGTRIDSPGSSLEDRSCEACASGSFSSEANLGVCTPWKTCEAPAQLQSEVPSAESDRQCDACAEFTATAEDNATECIALAFQMADDQVAIEAEHYTALDNRGNDASWTEIAVSAISNGYGLQIGPEAGAFWTNDPANEAPRLDYKVNFTRAGSFTLFIRGDAGEGQGGSDSCFAGLDGVLTPSYVFSSTPDDWGWQGQALDVATPGVHIVTVYAREDGFRVDKLVILAESTAPTGNGPAESPRQ